MVTPTQNKFSFNNNKIVIDTDKLQSLLTKHNIDVISFCKETIYDKYDIQFMEKKKKLNIKRKPSEKQKAASKVSLKGANTPRTEESVDEEDLKNKTSQEEKIHSENKFSQENESSFPHISDAMLEINTSSAATSQGGSDSDDECESGEEEMNKDESHDSDEYSD
ncbi:hypothetical protein BDC45DRAFT_567160 [Circinella umbellata]|nr:hypothetical protein BDC45DRAFT_567160 [Circinella umbellata]